MDGLTRCVGDPDVFRDTLRRRVPAMLRPPHPPVDVLPLATVLARLDDGLLTHPYLQVVRHEGPVPAERFCPPRIFLDRVLTGHADAPQVRRLVGEQGCTLLLRYVDHWHRGVRDLTESIARQLDRQVEAFYFVTPPGTSGRPVHRDDADVLVVQIAGAKLWRIHAGPDDGAWEPSRVADPGPVLLEVVVRPGEVLYVPRGHAHAATAVGDAPSVHLSLTIREAGTAHLYALLDSVLTEELELPPRPLDDASLHTTAADLLARMRLRLDELTPEGLVAAARAGMRPDRVAHAGQMPGLTEFM
ncbi:JmjC domain-containing protein [Nocardia crassostreae]|uniref:JmjC domain-containing protein n=1 Tax=Nocardia crassostreae TaxID=53428 RepID=UPI00082D0C7E|nr:cupin domain-containing protein [Nocardia crassostreae]